MVFLSEESKKSDINLKLLDELKELKIKKSMPCLILYQQTKFKEVRTLGVNNKTWVKTE